MGDFVVSSRVEAFESASELRERHAQLLDALDRHLGPEVSTTAEAAALSRMEPEIREFLERGAATGVYLDEVRERTACQVLLDYWVSSLARAALGAPPARLAPFDGGKLPDLEDKPCPYVGLDAFRGREFFFGRESDTQALLDQLRRTPLVVVLGASGSGKSSLVMGGVLPALTDPDPQLALRLAPPIVPGTEPLAHLAEAVIQASGDNADSATAAKALEANPGDVGAMLGGDHAPATLITVDQFEEVFTLTDVAGREALAAVIASLLESDRGHQVILTMREEFRSRLVELRDLSRFLDKAWYSMRPMGYEELRATVERPAALVNLQFQAGIIDDLVKKVLGQPAALPLLQFTLRTLWDRRDRNRVTWEVYREVGDPLTALKTSADGFYDALATQTQTEVRRILLELVRVDELLEAYRQPVPESRLLQAGKANTEEVLRLLTLNDYVRTTPGRGGEEAIVEVKHEALIRNWPRLVTWIDEKRIERRQRIALTQAAQRWAQSGKPEEGLLTGWQLEEAKRQRDLSEVEREFVEASARQLDRLVREREQALQQELARERRRAQVIRWSALAVILFLLGMTLFVLYLNREATYAERTARLALGQASTQEAVRILESSPGEALAHLARTLHADPDSLAARSLSSDLLLNGRVWVPRASLDHQQAVMAAALSADGRRVVTASADAAGVWDAATGQPVGRPLQHASLVNAVAFNPHGDRVVTASADNTAQVWDVVTGGRIGAPLKHLDNVTAAVFSPDGQSVVTVSADATAHVWDASTGQPVGPALRHEGAVNAAAFSPDGRHVITASVDTTARIWDVRTGQPVGEPLRHGDAVNAVAYSRDGSRVVTASNDATARIWSFTKDKPVAVSLPHQRAVLSAVFSPDGRRVVTASADSTARVWDAATGEPPGVPLEHNGPVNSATFSFDGRQIITVSADGVARLWAAATGRPAGEPFHHEGPVNTAAFSSDGRRLVTASADKTARIWDRSPGQPIGEPLPVQGRAFAAFFGPKAARVVIVSGNTAQVRDVARGQAVGASLRHHDVVNAVAFSFDGSLVVTGSADGTAIVWNATTGGQVGTTLLHRAAVSAVAFSSDGRRVVTASADKTARVFDAATGQPASAPFQHSGEVRLATFSSDGRRIVTTSADNTVRAWDTAGGPIGAAVELQGAISSCGFSPDGPRAVTVSRNTARVWDAATGQPVGAALQHGDTVYSVAFSPDGRRVVTASADGTARVWDAATGQSIGAALRHPAGVTAAVFSADAHHVITASADNTNRVWQVMFALSEPGDVQRLADLAEVVGDHRVTDLSSVVRLTEDERLERLNRLVDAPATVFVPVEVLLRRFLDRQHPR